MVNKKIYVRMMSEVVEISENPTEKLPRHFGYFTLSTMTVDILTPHLCVAKTSVT